MKPNLTAIAAGAVVPWPSNQKNACDGITNTACPIVKGEHVIYSYKMDILSLFPEVSKKNRCNMKPFAIFKSVSIKLPTVISELIILITQEPTTNLAHYLITK